MIHMTPLQSWALIALMFIVIVYAVHVVAKLSNERTADTHDLAEVDTDAADHEQTFDRPELVLIEGGLHRTPERPVYDWAHQGL